MLRVGLTGGVASGKSLVAEHFAGLGTPVVDADVVAREVVRPGTPGLEAVTAAFGRDLLTADGTLDRAALRERIFREENARRELEGILHPLIRAHMDDAVAARAAEGHAWVLCVVPLLVETGQTSRHDRVVVIDTPEWLQRERLCRRDGIAGAAADAVLASQVGRWRRLQVADDVVVNGDTVPQDRGIACQARCLDRKFRLLARRGI